jgi:hypothetical protein
MNRPSQLFVMLKSTIFRNFEKSESVQSVYDLSLLTKFPKPQDLVVGPLKKMKANTMIVGSTFYIEM